MCFSFYKHHIRNKMKKILLLGGSRYLLPVINAIHQLGYYAITCDYLPDNIAHTYSDEYYNVSIIEKDKVLELARKLRVDGIMSFACDPGVETAAYVAEKLGLPTNPYESVRILQNKSKFREFLRENGFNVPKARGYTSIDNAIADTEYFHYPVIVKPVDSAGSKGVTRVDEKVDLKEAAKYAISYSKAKAFIIEEFIEKEGCSSDSDCFSINGRLVFTSFSDQRFDEQAENPYTPAAFSWPSTMPEKIQDELRKELQRLIQLLNLNTSIYNIEARQGKDGKAYIMEVSPRGGGNRLSEMLKYATETDLILNAVKAAVGDEIFDINGEPQYKGFWAEIILHSEIAGVFEKLWIDNSLKENIVEEDLWVQKGDIVHEFTGANETIGTLVLRFDSQKQIEECMNNLDKLIKVVVKREAI